MNDHELLLIDFSSIAVPIWLMSSADPDPNAASIKMVARVRQLAATHPSAAIGADSGKSFRHQLDPAYKANRPPSDEPMHHQIRLAKETLVRDGFPVWEVKGFEADDVIASAVQRALAGPDLTVLIVSSDKDLLALVGPRVRAMSARDGSIVDAEAVKAKLGVTPEQVRDFLCLVGDASDNVKGANGIGPKKAADLLTRFGSLDHLYEEMKAVGPLELGIPAGLRTALKEFEPRFPAVRSLITLRTDVSVPFDEIARERVPKEVETFGMEEMDPESAEEVERHGPASPVPARPKCDGTHVRPRCDDPQCWLDDQVYPPSGTKAPASTTAIAVREPADVLAPAPAEWERQLDPRSMKDAIVLAKNMYDSRMFSAYGTPQGVMSTIMVGRELGLPAMASLRSVHVIEGRHSLSASLMVALVLKAGLAEFFEPISFSETEATYETKRKGSRNPIKLTHTFEMGRQAWPKEKPDWEKRFLASGWGRNPTDMLVARAQSRLARMIYPDLLAGLYTPDELAEIREAEAA